MKFQRGRIRNRFLKMLEPKMTAFEKNRLELVHEFAVIDKKTKNPLVENGNYKIEDSKMEKFNKEFRSLVSEDCIIDILPSTEKEIGDIKQIINETPLELGNADIEMLEEILTAFNNIGPLPEKKKGK